MTALALTTAEPPVQVQFDALQRARWALAEATLAVDLHPVAVQIDGIRRALKAFEVADEVRRQADELFIRAVYAFGVALREEYGMLGPNKIAATLGARVAIVRAATSMARPGGKSLQTYLDYIRERDLSANQDTLWHVSIELNRVLPPRERKRASPPAAAAKSFHEHPVRCPNCRQLFFPE